MQNRTTQIHIAKIVGQLKSNGTAHTPDQSIRRRLVH